MLDRAWEVTYVDLQVSCDVTAVYALRCVRRSGRGEDITELMREVCGVARVCVCVRDLFYDWGFASGYEAPCVVRA